MIKNLVYFVHALIEIDIEVASKCNIHYNISFFIAENKIFISIK